MYVVSAFCRHNISNNCVTSNMNNKWCKKQECKKAAGVAIRGRRVRLQSARAKTKLGRSSSKRFRSCFTNKPPDGATSGFARLLDKSSIVGMNINISTFFESFILKKHKSHSVLILYSQSEMCGRFILFITIFHRGRPNILSSILCWFQHK